MLIVYAHYILYCFQLTPARGTRETQHAAGQEFVDVEEVASEVHDAERDRLLHMDVSSDEGDVVPHFPCQRSWGPVPTRSTQPRVQSAALSVQHRDAWCVLRRPARSATSRSSRAQRTQREASPPNSTCRAGWEISAGVLWTLLALKLSPSSSSRARPFEWRELARDAGCSSEPRSREPIAR